MGGMMPSADLDVVFGPGEGSPAARAARSDQRYVRSQIQLARFEEKAKGRVLTATEALDSFGLPALVAVHRDGSFPLVWKSGEPAETLRRRREEMNISVAKLASATGLSKAVIQTAETANKVLPIRQLERICQFLALDERVLGFAPSAKSDRDLGVRLRQLHEQRDTIHFSEAAVLKLAEAGWVIARQYSLAQLLGERFFEPFEKPDYDLSYPAWKHGFRLAAQTRRYLDIAPCQPIESLRDLLEDRLFIPLIQQDLGLNFAGATISNGTTRGIVVNESGANSNVWVRRMTMCHELGHLLWDPDQHLNKLKVDSYDDVVGDFKNRTDPVEIRANAFAVAFLAPPEAVASVFSKNQSDDESLFEISQTYGISVTAARYHAANTLGRAVGNPTTDYPQANDEWESAENRSVDYFPIRTTPITRRGHFAYLIAKAAKQGIISNDSAASLLGTTVDEFLKNIDAVIDITSGTRTIN